MRYLPTALLLLLLAACSDKQPAATQVAVSAEDQVTEQNQIDLPAWIPVIPGNVHFDIPAHLRNDVIYQTSAGATRRRLNFELLEATPEQAQSAVTKALSQAGYVGEAPKAGRNDRYSIRYKKEGAPNLNVTFFPVLARTPANPDAKSMITISWQTKRAPKKADA